jgi:hypothetical protein
MRLPSRLWGWYLLVPPIKGLPNCARIDSNAPLFRWDHIASFDNARACQNQLRYDVDQGFVSSRLQYSSRLGDADI